MEIARKRPVMKQESYTSSKHLRSIFQARTRYSTDGSGSLTRSGIGDAYRCQLSSKAHTASISIGDDHYGSLVCGSPFLQAEAGAEPSDWRPPDRVWCSRQREVGLVFLAVKEKETRFNVAVGGGGPK